MTGYGLCSKSHADNFLGSDLKKHLPTNLSAFKVKENEEKSA